MNRIVLNTETAILKVVQVGNTGNIGNCICEVVKSDFFTGMGKRITTIPNPEMGKLYEQYSEMVPFGYGQNWEIISTNLLP